MFVPDHQHDYVYDRRGLQTEWRSDRGRRIKREFHDNGLLESRSARKSADDPTSRDYAYAYDPNGSLTTLEDEDLGRTTSVTYDDADRASRVNETWNGGRDTIYAYDPDGNVSSRRVDGRILPASEGGGYAGGRETRFAFDEVGREESMTVVVPGAGADRVTSTTYWPSDQVRQRVKARGATDRMTGVCVVVGVGAAASFNRWVIRPELDPLFD